MSSIDNRIVSMKFENSQFENKVRQTESSLKNLDKALKLQNGVKGLQEVQTSASKLNLNGLVDGVSSVSDKFNALKVIGVTALATITTKAVQTGMALANSFAIAPITQGFGEYELKMGSIQTILANTAKYGTKTKDVNKALDALNTYADKTIYNFAEMTNNIGMFTNAGIKLEDATSMIKGFSNEAAASGTNSARAANAAYQLSQAMSAGVVKLMDWRSLTNAGMGSANMRKGLVDIAEAMGTIKKSGLSADKVTKDFNNSLAKGWLTADVMTNYLRIMAGDMSDAEMKTIGLTKAQIKYLKTQATTAEDAATKVRTFSQLIGTVQEAVGSGWAKTFEILIGDFDGATELLTGVNNVVSSFVDNMSDARNNLLQGWVDLGGRKRLIEGFAKAFQNVSKIGSAAIKPFKEIFSSLDAKSLTKFTDGFVSFLNKLKPSEKTLENISRVFRGLYSILGIVTIGLRAVGTVITSAFSSLVPAGGSLLDLFAKIGDKIHDFYKSLNEGSSAIFDWSSKVGGSLGFIVNNLAKFIGAMMQLPGHVVNATTKISIFDGLLKRTGTVLGFIAKTAKKVASTVFGVINKIAPIVGKAAKKVAGFVSTIFGEIGHALSEAFKYADFDVFMALLNTGLFGGLLVILRNFTKKFKAQVNFNFGPGGVFNSLRASLDSLTGTLSAMQSKLKSEILKNIAISIAILAASVTVLAAVNPERLASAIAGISGLMAEMILFTSLFSRLDLKGIKGSVSLITMSTALLVLSAAAKNLSSINFNDLNKGLYGVTGLLASVALFSKFSGGIGVFRTAGLISLGVAMNILAEAVAKIGALDIASITKGTAAVGVLLIELGVFNKLASGAGVFSSALGVVALATSMVVLAKAVKTFSSLNILQLSKGLASVAAGLIIFAGAIKILPKNTALRTAGLLSLSASLLILSKAVASMGSMSLKQIGKGLSGLAAGLGVMTSALKVLSSPKALAGAAALSLLSTTIGLIFVPAMVALGTINHKVLATGMAAMAGGLLILIAAAYAVSPIVTALLGLSAAILILGLAVTAAGAGVALFGSGVLATASGLAILAKIGSEACSVIGKALDTLISRIGSFFKGLANGFVDAFKILGRRAKEIGQALLSLITQALETVKKSAPKWGETAWTLLSKMLDSFDKNAWKVIEKGSKIALKFLDGLIQKSPEFVQKGLELLSRVLDGVEKGLPSVVRSAVRVTITFLNSVAKELNNPKNQQQIATAIRGIAKGIIDIFGKTIGVNNLSGKMRNALVEIPREISRKMSELYQKMKELGRNAIQGFASGITSSIPLLRGSTSSVASAVTGGIKSLLQIFSPSRVLYKLGRFAVQGFINGIENTAKGVQHVVTEMTKPLLNIDDFWPDDFGPVIPVIKPVVDLSNVRAAKADVSNLLSFTRTMKVASGTNTLYYGATSQKPVESTGVTYIQNNYSPKAIDSTEVYRQTNTLLSLKRG